MKVITANPRGFCHGVVHAMHLVSNTISDPNTVKPIYILGEIVHNKNVTDAFKLYGVTTLSGGSRRELLDQISSGTVIITAHGIDPNLIDLAQKRGLNIVDATCSDVYKTHNIIKDKLADGYEVVYIGKKGHPEPEGVLGIDLHRIHLVESMQDIEDLQLTTSKLCVTNQTTMSIWDVQSLIDSLVLKYSHIEVIDEICDATRQRQLSVLTAAKDADLTIIVGDPKSNNTNKLVEVSTIKAFTPAIRINNLEELDINLLLDSKVEVVCISSGASTPSLITRDVIGYVEQFDKKNESTWEKKQSFDLKRIVPRVRK